MISRLSNVKVIGTGLALLYGTSLLIYMNSFRSGAIEMRAVILSTLLLILLTASIAVIQLREWGRILLVAGNAAMGIYLLIPFLVTEALIPMSFIFMNVVILLFFNQDKIKGHFKSMSFLKGGKRWRSILVIDDDQILIKTVRPILMNNGFAVLTASTGEEGLQIARSQKPDLVILDVILPGVKGRDVCRQLKQDVATNRIPVIFLTAKQSEDDVAAEKQAGAAAHLTKPVDPKTLTSTVREVLNEQAKS